MDENNALSETTDYYPFGMPYAKMGNTASVQPDKYNGLELDMMHGLNWYDNSARWYDPALGRFTGPDPLAKNTPWISPYAWCGNNPVRWVDLERRWFGPLPSAVPMPPVTTPIPAAPPISTNPPPLPSLSEVGNAIGTFIDNKISQVKFVATLIELTMDVAVNKIKDNTESGNTKDDLKGKNQSENETNKKVNPKKEAREKAKEERDNQKASEKRAKDLEKDLEKAKGPDARREAHDAKEKGSGDRTLKQLLEDYNPDNY